MSRASPFKTVVAVLLALLWGAAPLRAELALELFAPSVTNGRFAAIVLEASSSHVAASVFFPGGPEGAPLRTEVVGVAIHPISDSQAMLVALLGRAPGHAALNALGGAGSLAARILSDGFVPVTASGQPLPHADIRLALQVDPRAAQDFAAWLRGRETGGRMSYQAMQDEGITLFRHATILSQVAVNRSRHDPLPRLADASGGFGAELDAYLARLQAQSLTWALPDASRVSTALGWLYALALQLSPEAGAAGCTQSEDHRIGTDAPPDGTPAALFRRAMAEMQPDAAPEGWWIGRILGLAREFDRMDSVYAEFVALGDVDPTVLDAVACTGRLLARGGSQRTASIRERAGVYQTFNDMVQAAAPEGPRFFGTAHLVSRLIGFGAADVVATYQSASLGAPVMTTLADLAVPDECRPPGQELPGQAAIALLQDVNARLFEQVNLPVIRRLVADPGTLFDPFSADFGPLPETPATEGLPSGLRFDLRMVLREQTGVGTLMGPITSAVDDDLTGAQRMLSCLRLHALRAVLPQGYAEQLDILARVDILLQGLMSDGVIDRSEARFGNIWWRVAVGMSHMFVARGITDERLDRLGAVLREAIEADQRRNAGAAALSAPLRAELRARVNAVNAAQEALVPAESVAAGGSLPGARDLAANIFLDTDLGERELFDCPAGPGIALVTRPVRRTVAAVDERIDTLIRSGLAPLARAYELMPGAALDTEAVLTGGAAVDACAAIRARRESFERLVAPGARFTPLLDLLDGSSAEMPPILVMARSVELRRYLGEIAPFFSLEAARPAWRMTDAAAVIAAMDRAGLQRDLYAAQIALLDTVVRLTPAQRQAVSPELEWLQTRIGDLRAQALPDLDPPATPPSGAEVEAGYGFAPTLRRIERVRRDLPVVLAPVLAAFAGSRGPASALGSPVRMEAAGGAPVAGAVRPEDRDETAPALSEALFGTALDFQLTATRAQFAQPATSAGRTVYEAELSYRRIPATAVTATVDHSCPVEGPGCNTAGQQQRRVGLGIIVTGIDLTDDGRLTLPDTSAFRDHIRIDPQRLQTGLEELGFPRFVTALPFDPQISFYSDSLRISNLSLGLHARIGDIDLGTMQVHFLIDGVAQDIDQQLTQALETAVARDLESGLNASARYLQLARLPAGDEFDTAEFRFSALPASARDGFRYLLDVPGRSLVLQPVFLFEAFAQSGTPVALRARGEVVLDERGLGLRSLVFEPEGMEAAMAALAAHFIALFDLPPVAARSLTVLPELDGLRLGLRLRAGFSVEGCDVSLDARLPIGASLDTPVRQAEGEALSIRQLIGQFGAQLAGCAIQEVVARIPVDAARLSLFGVDFRVEPGAADLVALVAVGDVLAACPELAPFRIEGVRFGPEGIDLGGLTQTARTMAGRFLECQLRQILPAQYLMVSNLAIGPGLLAADLQLVNMPFLGTLDLGRQNFLDADLAEGFRVAVVSALQARASQAATEALQRAFTDGALELAGIGTLRLADGADAATVALTESRPGTIDGARVTLRGRLALFGEIEAHARLTITLRGTTPEFDIALEEDVGSLLAGSVTQLLQASLPLVSDAVGIRNPIFGPLDAGRQRWGLVFGLDLRLPLPLYPIDLKLERVEISRSGVTLDDEIRVTIPMPMYFGPLAMNGAIVIYHTGQGSGAAARQGLTIGADLTFVEPQVSRLLKIEATLDLREVVRQRFALSGQLIALDSLPLMVADGVVDLGAARMAFDVHSTDLIRPVLDLSGTAAVDVPAGRLDADTRLAILGLEVSQSRIAFCARACGASGQEEGFADLSSRSHLGIGVFALHARTDLDLGNPTVDGGVDLDLFGWRPGGAGLSASLDRAQARLSLLGLRLNVTTPSIRTMTPSLLLRILQNIFDISLEDLLKIDPTNIRLTLLSGGGSADSVGGEGESGGEDGAEGQSAADAGQRQAEERSREGRRPAPVPARVDPGQEDPESSEDPGQGPWHSNIRTVGVVCHKIVGGSAYSLETGEPEARFSLRTQYRTDNFVWPGAWYWQRRLRWWDDNTALPLPASERDLREYWLSDSMFTERAAARICQLQDGPRLRDGIVDVGVGRSWSVGAEDFCDGARRQSLRLRPIANPREDHGEIARGGLPVLCLPSGRPLFTRLMLDSTRSAYVAIVFCPAASRLSPEDRRSPVFERACNNQGFAEVGVAEAFDGAERTPAPLYRLTAEEELDLYNRFIRPRLMEEQLPVSAPRHAVTVDRGRRPALRGSYSESIGDDGVQQRSYVVLVPGQGNRPGEMVQLAPIRSSDGILWDYWTREGGFEGVLLSEWIDTGRRPRIVDLGESPRDWLVLEAPDDSGFLRIYQPGNGAGSDPLRLRLPQEVPLGTTRVHLAPVRIEPFLPSIHAVIGRLDHGIWRLSAGQQADPAANFLLFEPLLAAADDARLDTGEPMIEVIALFDPVGPGADDFLAALPAAEAARDPDRLTRRCFLRDDWIESLRQDFEPDVAAAVLQRNDVWREALLDPGGFLVRRPELTQTPLFGLLQLDACS